MTPVRGFFTRRGDALHAQVVVQHVQNVTHLDPAGVVQAALGQDLVKLRGQLGLFLELVGGLDHLDVAGGAGGDDVIAALLLRQGQVAGVEGLGLQLGAAHIVNGGAAAVPVVDLLELEAQGLGHRLDADHDSGSRRPPGSIRGRGNKSS